MGERECNLLELPAELRNEIYELSFIVDNQTAKKTGGEQVGEHSSQDAKDIAQASADGDTDQDANCCMPVAVDVLQATGPGNALLATCRQIYAEAKPIYTRAYRNFWTEGNFFASLVSSPYHRILATCARICTTDVDNVRRLRVQSVHSPAVSIHYDALPSGNAWLRTYRSLGVTEYSFAHAASGPGNWTVVEGNDDAIRRIGERGQEDARMGMVAQLRGTGMIEW